MRDHERMQTLLHGFVLARRFTRNALHRRKLR
jgi:hypothetical protein